MKGEVFESFPNYTKEMYDGNEPSCKGHQRHDGGFADRWYCRYGGMETHNGEVICANFQVKRAVTVYIVGDSLWIVKNLQSGVYQYCYKYAGMPGGCCINRENIHDMPAEEAERVLNTKIENCKCWDIVQSRAKELFAKSVRCSNGRR